VTSWRVARGLDILLEEINDAAPRRSKISDGSIGDQAHRQRVSEHNPDRYGVVAARDYTHDPVHGADMARLSKFLVTYPHPALWYVIFQGRIANRKTGFRWTAYTGPNRHDHHMHVSTGPHPAYDDGHAWGAALAWRAPQQLRIGARSEDVAFLQRMLKVPRTNVLDATTLAAVRKYQAAHKLTVDGIVGPKTWGMIL